MKSFALVKYFLPNVKLQKLQKFFADQRGMLQIVAQLAACSNESLEILHNIGITRFRAFRRLEAAVFLKQLVLVVSKTYLLN